MNDPGPPASHLRRDAVRGERLLARPGDWRALGAGRMAGAEARGAAPLRLRLASPGLEGLDCLALTLGNLGEAPLLAGLYLWWGRPGHPPLAFSGGRALLPPGRSTRVILRKRDFGAYGPAGDWAGVTSLELLAAREKGAGPGRAALALGELWGQQRSEPRGPRLTARGLASLLLPGDGPPAAPHGLDHPGLRLPPPVFFPRASADELLTGRVMGEEVGFPWDWEADPRQALEWRHFLHRHHDLRTLALAWAEEGRADGLAALRRLLSDWIGGHPAPLEGNGGAGPSWETLTAAWRLLEWCWVRGLAWENLGPRLRGLLRRSLWEHARHLGDHQGHPTNWALIEAAALALAGLTWPEFKEAQAWTDLGLARLAGQCRRQFHPDGSHCEFSPLYQALCLQALLMARRACLACVHAWPRAAEAALRRGLEHLAGLARPDHTWPALNDSGGADGEYAALLAWAERDLGRPLRAGSRHWPQAGLVVLRNGPGRGDPWLLLRAGPPGLAHAHQDGLSLEVHIGGRPRVVDPGMGSYAPGPLAERYRQAASHSQPLLDGQGARPDPLATRLERAPGLLLAWGQGATPGGGGLSRMVLLVGREYALVWDRAWGREGGCVLEVGWQMAPGPWRGLGDGRGWRAEDGFVVRLIHAPAEAVLRRTRGWVRWEGRDRSAPHWRLRARGESPLDTLWLLAPGEGRLVLETVPAPEGLGLLVSRPDGSRDRLTLSARPGETRLVREPAPPAGRSERRSRP